MLTPQIIKQYLAKGYTMQLSTSVDNQPWSCSVYYVFDDKLNLYWASLPSRRHSQEIEINSKVSAAIVIKQSQKVIGVQVQGKAKMLEDKNMLLKSATLYSDKFDRSSQWVEDIANNRTAHRLYVLVPELYVVFDETKALANPRSEYRL